MNISSDQLQAILAAATLLTAVVGLLTILEMRRQRRSQYRPEIVVEERGFRVWRRVSASEVYEAVATVHGELPQAEVFAPGRLRVPCKNVGLGAAKNVLVGWKYDARHFVEQIALTDRNVGGEVWVDGDFAEFRGESGAGWASRVTMDLQVGTLMPLPIAPERELELPWAYQQLLSLFLAAVIPDRLPKSPEIGPIPPLSLEIRYRDLEGNPYRKSFRVELSISHLSSRDKGADDAPWVDAGGGQIEVREA